MSQRLEEAQRLAEKGLIEKAWELCEAQLEDTPEDHHTLILASFLLERKNSPSLSYQVATLLTQKFPLEAAGWLNLGRCCDILWRMDEALECYEKALVTARSDKARCTIYVNLGAVYTQLADWDKAREASLKALAIEPENRKARHNYGLCQLANREWEDGWKNYKYSIGSGNRTAFNYCGEDEWDGTPNKKVVVYGEQGIGDEICFASMFPDLIKVSEKVIIDCDKRLETLFKRSFPDASVYGSRGSKVLDWREEDRSVDASISSGSLGGFFRNNDADFHDKPYLEPDHEKTFMWRALFESKRKPAIGIAWSGGLKHTAAHARTIALESLTTLFGGVDAHWVSLQYRNAQDEIDAAKSAYGIELRQYPHATLGSDYDETASMVAALDYVVSVPTSIVHLAGAIGTPCIVMKAPISCWKFSSGLPFHPKVELVENTGWGNTIKKTAELLKTKI